MNQGGNHPAPEEPEMIEQRAFLILGLPRSRTAWLSQLFTVGPSFCSHDLTSRCRSARELLDRMIDREAVATGNSDSGNIFVLEKVMELVPETNLIWIVNDPEEVVRSLSRATRQHRDRFRHPVERLCALQNRAMARYGGMILPIEQMDEEDAIRQVWSHATRGLGFPWEHWQALRTMRIKIHDEILQEVLAGNGNPDSEIARHASTLLAE